MRRPRLAKLLSYGLAVVALSFVAWVVPLRDRCWDPAAPRTTRVAVTREAQDAAVPAGQAAQVRQEGGCVLHLATGPVRITALECAQLRCEPGVASAFHRARGGIVAALLTLYALSILAWAARWRALLDLADIELPLGQVWRISVEAQAGGILLPGGLGGDALRVAAVVAKPTRSGAPAPATLVVASVMLDRAVGLGVVAALAAALGFAFGGVNPGPLAVALGAIPLGLLAGLVVLRVAPIQRIPWLSRGRLADLVSPVLAYVRDRRAVRAIVIAAALSILVAGVQFAVVRGLVLSLGETPTSEKWIYVGTAMAFIVAAIPALPGGWGTADAAYVFFFGLAGVSVATALAVCLIYRLFWYLSGVLGAVLYVSRQKSSPMSPPSPPVAP